MKTVHKYGIITHGTRTFFKPARALIKLPNPYKLDRQVTYQPPNGLFKFDIGSFLLSVLNLNVLSGLFIDAPWLYFPGLLNSSASIEDLTVFFLARAKKDGWFWCGFSIIYKNNLYWCFRFSANRNLEHKSGEVSHLYRAQLMSAACQQRGDLRWQFRHISKMADLLNGLYNLRGLHRIRCNWKFTCMWLFIAGLMWICSKRVIST